jgi:NADPH:quinone reductase-like Zn-dependent oxidoreductase
MRPNGADLEQLTKLIEAGAIRPVLDRTFPFAETPQAMAYVETGRAKGKVVVSMG